MPTTDRQRHLQDGNPKAEAEKISAGVQGPREGGEGTTEQALKDRFIPPA